MNNGRGNRRGKHAAKGRPTLEHDFFVEAIEASMVPSDEQILARDHRLALKLNKMTHEQRAAYLERRSKWESAYEHPASPVWLTLAMFAVASIVTAAVQLFTTQPVILGVAVVVLIGGAGLMLRGFGELSLDPPLNFGPGSGS